MELILKRTWIFAVFISINILHLHGAINKCPGIKGCVCDRIWSRDGIRFRCSEAEDPPLHLIPHENITSILFIRSTFHNISAIYELRKTNARRISLIENKFVHKKMTSLNWNCMPSTIFNISVSENGFDGFTDGNKTGMACRLHRFKNNITLQIRGENIIGMPECIPESTSTLILNNMPASNETQPEVKWPEKISLLKIVGGGMKNFSKAFADAPSSLKRIWIHNGILDEGKWPTGLPANFVEKLILTHSKMHTISSTEMKRFQKANKLNTLILNYNNLKDIPKDLPLSLINLQMSHNKIYQVSPKNWENLSNLKFLDLSNNLLVMVPRQMPSTLQTLYFHGNLIEFSDPEAFIAMKNLEVLDLSDNKLSSMPRGIQPGIQKYLITHNQISIVNGPSDYNFCTSCSIFQLQANPWYCNTQMLQMLSWLISHDIIIGSSGFYEKSDTENVAYCSKIPIKGIDIYWLNVAIEYMEYIKQPPNDKCIYEIEYLTCQDAGLTSVPDQIPPNLENVIISDNPDLTFIPDDKFKTQTELKKLILNNNSISHIPIGLPKSLIMLELRDNEIGNWNSKDLRALQNLTNLRQIYLENNNISVLYAYQFEGLTEMNWVGLSRNQLHCDCSLQSFVIWFNDIAPRDYKFVGPSFPECSSPVSQQGMDIRHLHGHFIYGVQCAPIRCEWKSNNRPILNCSRAFLNDDSINTYKPPYEEGIAPVIPENSYWTSLDLSGLMLKDDQIQYSHLTRLMSVNLSENSLTQIPLTGFGPSVQIMNLSRNFIEHLPSTQEFKKYFPKIKSLDLSKNRIKHLDFVEVGTLEFVDTLLLTGNPFICNCSLRTLVEWIHVNKENTKMVRQHQLQELTCKTSQRRNARTLQIMSTKDEEYCPELPVVTIIISILSFILICVIIVFIVHVYMQRQRTKKIHEEILLGFQGLLEKEIKEGERDPETGMGLEKELKFDAFVSYDANGADAEFVMTLLEELEDKRGYKLCLNERDFMPGAGITDNIVECIGTSKRIILILSRTFVSSPWCQYEVQVALAELHHRRKSQLLISLLLEDISSDENLASSVRTFLSLVPSIPVPAYTANDNETWKKFWRELLNMMPNPSNII